MLGLADRGGEGEGEEMSSEVGNQCWEKFEPVRRQQREEFAF